MVELDDGVGGNLKEEGFEDGGIGRDHALEHGERTLIENDGVLECGVHHDLFGCRYLIGSCLCHDVGVVAVHHGTRVMNTKDAGLRRRIEVARSRESGGRERHGA